MNALQTRPSAAVAAPAGLVPRDLSEAMQLATLMSKSGLVPEHLQLNPANCLLVIEQAMRWRMSPFGVGQGTFVTKGKVGYSGALIAAAVEQNAPLEGHLEYELSGEGEARRVTVSAKLIGESRPRTVEAELARVRTTNEHWKRNPDQMLCYHAARMWARRHTPGVIYGAYAREEIEDQATEDLEPRAVPNLEEPPPPPPPPGSLREVAQQVEAQRTRFPVIAPSGAEHEIPLAKYLAACVKALAGLEDRDAVRAWARAMAPHIEAAGQAEEESMIPALISAAIIGRIRELTPPDELDREREERGEEEAPPP